MSSRLIPTLLILAAQPCLVLAGVPVSPPGVASIFPPKPPATPDVAALYAAIQAAPETLGVSGAVADVPAEVQGLLGWQTSGGRPLSPEGGSGREVSDFGGPLNTSDVFNGQPHKRLIFTVRLGEYQLVEWEEGGHGALGQGLAFHLDPSGPTVVGPLPAQLRSSSPDSPQAGWVYVKNTLAPVTPKGP